MVSAIPVENTRPGGNESTAAKTKPTKRRAKFPTSLAFMVFFGIIFAGAVVAGLYLELIRGPSGLLKGSILPSSALSSSAQQGMVASDGEIMPPVGRGQHFTLGNVRYCHFQAARLKIMQPQVQGPEAVRAFNLLVVDYNSRCSDFLYKDSDVAVVSAELKVRRPMLEADAKRIMSTWSGRLPPVPRPQPNSSLFAQKQLLGVSPGHRAPSGYSNNKLEPASCADAFTRKRGTIGFVLPNRRREEARRPHPPIEKGRPKAAFPKN